MSPLSDDRPDLLPGEAIRECVGELGKLHPDYQRAQVYATLALRESARSGRRDPAGIPALTCGYTTVIYRPEMEGGTPAAPKAACPADATPRLATGRRF